MVETRALRHAGWAGSASVALLVVGVALCALAGYAVAVLCLTGFWSGGRASAAFGLWLLGAVLGVLRAARRTAPTPTGSGAGGRST